MSWKKGRPSGGTTTSRGYGAEHTRIRRQYVAALRDGDPCARCRAQGKYHPIYRSQIPKLHLDHNDSRTAYIGLSAAACNLRDGARRGRARQQAAAPIRYSRVW